MGKFQTKHDDLKLNDATKLRMTEVEFYLFFKRIFDYAMKDDAIAGREYMQLVARISGLSPLMVSNAFDEIRKPMAKPTKQEISIYARYKGFPYSEISANLGVAPATVSKYIKRYVDSDQPTLFAKLGVSMIQDFEEIMEQIKIHFAPIADLMSMLKNAEKK